MDVKRKAKLKNKKILDFNKHQDFVIGKVIRMMNTCFFHDRRTYSKKTRESTSIGAKCMTCIC